MGVFKRGLSDEFMAALAELAQKPGWWQDVLADASLIIGIRKEEFDVYWHGQSLFNADFKGGRVNVNTHIKYLLDPDRDDRVRLEGRRQVSCGVDTDACELCFGHVEQTEKGR